MTRVYIIGESRGVYRIQHFIKFLTDNFKIYRLHYSTICFDNRILRYLKSFFINGFNILQCNVVYMNSLNADIDIYYELFLAKILRKKIIVDFYVSVFETVVLDRKIFKENSVGAKLALLCDRILINFGDKVLFVSNAEKVKYCRTIKFDVNDSKLIVIPLCIENRLSITSKFIYGNRDLPIICWWGSYLPLHGISAILKSIKILKESGIKLQWFFLGDSEEKYLRYQTESVNLGIEEDCKFINNYSFNNGLLQDFLQENCDIALGSFGDTEKGKTVSTNKIIEACSMRTIVITRKSESTIEYFGNTNSVFICDNDPLSIANEIKNVIDYPKEGLIERINNGLILYEKFFTPKIYQENLRNLFDSIS